MDPLYDPDDEALLDPRQARELAGLIEKARLSCGAIRYGRTGRVGVADVVINKDNPLPGGNHACGLWGTPAEVGSTLLSLERTFADIGRAEAVVYASPSTVVEIDGIADDAGWRAVEENVELLHRGRQEPPPPRGTGVPRPARDTDLPGIGELLADDAGLSDAGQARLVRNLEHRLDDPRCTFSVVDDAEADRPAGFASGFLEHGVALIDQVSVRTARRRRGAGRALVADVVAGLRERGALLIAGRVEEGGSGERFAEACGFEAVYGVTAYARRVDELLD